MKTQEVPPSPSEPPGNVEILDVHWVFSAAAQRLAFWMMEFEQAQACSLRASAWIYQGQAIL